MVDNVLEHQHVAVGIFLLYEQGEKGPSPWRRQRLRPGSDTGLGPEASRGGSHRSAEHPLLGIALPSAVAPGGSAATWTPQSSGQQDPPHGRAGQMDILSLCQHLGQMGMVESRIGPLGQLHHLLLCPRARGGCRLSPPVPVSHSSCSLLSVRCQ